MRYLLLAAAIAMMLVPATAQAGNTGSVRGFIRAVRGGNAVPNAVVLVVGQTAVRRVKADSHGFFLIWDLPPGKYTMSAAGDGYFSNQRYLCIHADGDQYASLTIGQVHLLGPQFWHHLYLQSFEPDASETTDLYSLGACN